MATRVLSKDKFLRKVYSQEVTKIFSIKNVCFLPKNRIYFTFNSRQSSTYTRIADSTKDSYRIVLGGGMVAQSAALPEEFHSAAEANKYLQPADRAFQAMYYHEMGHILYTDMANRSIVEYPRSELRGFIHSVFNVLEDIVIERYCMSYYFPYTAKYFKHLVETIFVPQMKSYKDEPDNPNAFLQFLLLKLRLGSRFTGTSAVWSASQATLAPLILSVFREEDAAKRVEKSIKIAEWLIKNTKMDFSKMKFNQDEITAGSIEPGSGTGKPMKSGGTEAMDGMSGEGLDGMSGGKREKKGSSSNDRSSDSGFDGTKPELKKAKELDDLATAAGEIEDTYNPDNDLLLQDCKEIADSFNDVLGSYDNHMWVDAAQIYAADNKVVPFMNERILKVAPLATKVTKAFSVYRGRMRPKLNRGFHSGKLDIRTAMNNSLTSGCNTKLFKKKIANGNAPDLAISVLCDNSGSMGGNKAHVCTTAMLALAKACQMCNIPIEVNAFTEVGGLNYTIQMKKFSDSFEKAIPYLGITDDDVIDHYSHDRNIENFYGNQDEVNLYFVWKEFLRNKHKDKVIIVISDGETCGDSSALARLVKEIEKSGVGIIGLGIQSRAVERLYPKYKLFDTDKSLAALPDYLTQTLLKLAKGGK